MAKPASPTWNAGGEGTAGCIGYWLMHEGTGTTVNDISPAGNHGTLGGSGGPDWTTGAFGAALEDFANGHVGLDAHLGDLGTTAPIWFAILATTATKGAYASLVQLLDDAAAVQVELSLLADGKPSCAAAGSGGINWATDCADGNPHAYALVIRASNDLELWVDGVERATTAGPVGSLAGLQKWSLGKMRYGGLALLPWLGKIDCAAAGVGSVPDMATLHAEWLAGTFSAAVAPADATPPTLGTLATNTDGDEITGTLDESGCTPASGTGGFTLGGTSATVSGWAIAGTTLTLTLSGTVEYGETVTLSYDRDTTTDDIEDAAGNFLATFSGASVTNNVPAPPLVAGTASFVSSGPGGIEVEATAPTGGTGSLSYQWERNEDGGTYANVSGATSLTLDDATATTPGVLYRYRCKQTRGSDAVTTNAVAAQVYEGGAIGSGGGVVSAFVSPFIRG